MDESKFNCEICSKLVKVNDRYNEIYFTANWKQIAENKDCKNTVEDKSIKVCSKLCFTKWARFQFPIDELYPKKEIENLHPDRRCPECGHKECWDGDAWLGDGYSCTNPNCSRCG